MVVVVSAVDVIALGVHAAVEREGCAGEGDIALAHDVDRNEGGANGGVVGDGDVPGGDERTGADERWVGDISFDEDNFVAAGDGSEIKGFVGLGGIVGESGLGGDTGEVDGGGGDREMDFAAGDEGTGVYHARRRTRLPRRCCRGRRRG